MRSTGVTERNQKGWEFRLRDELVAASLALAYSGRTAHHREFTEHTFHLAVMVEPYLEWILQGRKTIESSFSMRRIAPYGVVERGDWLALKRSSGPVVGFCRVAKVQHHELDVEAQVRIRDQYSLSLCADDSAFWPARRRSR